MSEDAKPTRHKLAAFILSAVFFVVSVALLVLNARALSLISHSKGIIQNVVISNAGMQIQLSLVPEYLVRTGLRAMLAAGAGGIICAFLSMILSLRPYVYAHAWVAVIACILAITGLLSEYISYYKSSTLEISTVDITTTNGHAKGWYSVGSWFCQTKTVFAYPVSATFDRACNEDIVTRVLIAIYFVISFGLFIVAVTMKREERKMVQLVVEPKRYNGSEMHNIPL